MSNASEASHMSSGLLNKSKAMLWIQQPDLAHILTPVFTSKYEVQAVDSISKINSASQDTVFLLCHAPETALSIALQESTEPQSAIEQTVNQLKLCLNFWRKNRENTKLFVLDSICKDPSILTSTLGSTTETGQDKNALSSLRQQLQSPPDLQALAAWALCQNPETQYLLHEFRAAATLPSQTADKEAVLHYYMSNRAAAEHALSQQTHLKDVLHKKLEDWYEQPIDQDDILHEAGNLVEEAVLLREQSISMYSQMERLYEDLHASEQRRTKEDTEERVHEMDELKYRLQEAERLVQEFYGSNSYKMTAPLRWVRRTLGRGSHA